MQWRRPWLWPEQLLDRSSARRLRREKSLVLDGHDAERPLWRRVALAFLVGMAAMLVAAWAPEPYRTLVLPLIGWMIGSAAFMELARASAYRSGWLDGRMRFVQQMKSHDEAEAWLRTEADHDFVHVMGLAPLPPGSFGRAEFDE